MFNSENKRNAQSFVGRIVKVDSDMVTLLREGNGEPFMLARERIRSIVVMREGDVAGRLRTQAVKSLFRAARMLADPKHVGGNQQEAADLIAFAMTLIPQLSKGDGRRIWSELRKLGIEIE